MPNTPKDRSVRMFQVAPPDVENIDYLKKVLRTENASAVIRHALRVTRMLEESRNERGGVLYLREEPDRELTRLQFL